MPVQLIEGIPEPTTTHITYVTKPTKIIIKCGPDRYERIVNLRRRVVTPLFNKRSIAARRRGLKNRVTCGTSHVPLATRRARAALAKEKEAERALKIKWERNIAADRAKASAAAEARREACRRKGYRLVHANRLYERFEAVDEEHYPRLLSEGRLPGNAFFKEAFGEWRANVIEARAVNEADCESVS